jgi:ferredoxin
MPIVSNIDSNKTHDVKEGEILYDALYDRGEELPHGCLSGSCGACRVEIITGNSNLNPPGVIEQNTIDAVTDEFTKTKGKEFTEGKTIRLSCRAKIIGDVTFRPLR